MDDKKAAHMAAALMLLNGNAPMTTTRLITLMYLCERESLKQRGFPMVYDELKIIPD